MCYMVSNRNISCSKQRLEAEQTLAVRCRILYINVVSVTIFQCRKHLLEVQTTHKGGVGLEVF